ncbi:hypothetical protein JCM15415_12650 [Methanobacterium movens]
MKVDAVTEKEVKEVLNLYAKFYQEKDLDSLLNLCAPDQDLIFIGAGEDEWVQGWDEIKKGFKRDLEQADEIKIDYGSLNISASGPVAWSSSTMHMEVVVDDEKVILKGRLSMILEKREDKWLIVHLHFSIPSSNQKTGQSYPV